MKLTYNYLGNDVVPNVGNRLGVDGTGWPYQIQSVTHNEDLTKSYIELEPWPIPGVDATPQERIDFDQALVYASYINRAGAYVEKG